MRYRFMSTVIVLVVGFSSLAVAQGQRAGGQRGGRGAAAPSPTANLPFDPHDLSGIWLGRNRELALSDTPPPFTPGGKAKFDSYKPSYGPRAISPALGNDPQGNCDPLGIPRLLMFENNPWDFEIIQTKDRMIQVFDRHYTYRQIWTDGQKLDPNPPVGKFMGYSIGRWDGDSFVIESNGFDERTWLDHFGNPHSGDMRLEERYKRVNHDTIELVMTLTDPAFYTKPWMSATKTLVWQNRKDFADELFCVPSEEQEFNRTVRNPAAGVK